tara:strand:- start:45 stop:467 length:423 start_codon:yes stop_codon:yes gene_type:complete
MYGKKVKLRFIFIFVLILICILTSYLVLDNLRSNIVYFLSPSEVNELKEISNKKLRVGGMVKKNSIKIDSDNINFIITDFSNEIVVSFSGAVPNLFKEEKGVVAEGYLKDKNFFVASKILAKHDENYMPPEVRESLEANN